MLSFVLLSRTSESEPDFTYQLILSIPYLKPYPFEQGVHETMHLLAGNLILKNLFYRKEKCTSENISP